VLTPTYPLFREPQYLLSLANRIVQVSREVGLDIIHAHYAVPHATAAFLSRQVLASTGDRVPPRVVTTLHGTDITLVGNDASYSEIVAFSIDQSDCVTAVSSSLRASTYEKLGVSSGIAVIPNFLDCSIHRRIDMADLRRRFAGDDPATRIVIHVSNFRPVKRVEAVLGVFDRIRREVPARLLLVGDGPDLGKAHRMARELGVAPLVHTVGAQEEVVPLLSVSDLFLLPSAQESFGLAALEAMACEVPVVAARVGGLPEVIDDGETGFLCEPDDVEGMAARVRALLDDRAAARRLGQAAAVMVRRRYCAAEVVPRYERVYERVLA